MQMLKELERRYDLWCTLDAYIAENLQPSNSWLKRGDVQRQILNALGLPCNTPNCREVNARMNKAGYKTVRNTGYQYYTNVAQKP